MRVDDRVLISVVSTTTTTTTTQAPVTDDNSYVDGPVIISTYMSIGHTNAISSQIFHTSTKVPPKASVSHTLRL